MISQNAKHPFDQARHGRPRSAGDRLVGRPRKELGQRFLVDESILKRIVDAAALAPGVTVLEIGAGTGQLTNELQAAGANVAAVEIDEELSAHLRQRFHGIERVRPICANVLDHTPADLLAEAGLAPPYVVVANIPYYITGPILRTFLEAATRPDRLILTVQREVAESIAARTGAMSLLSVSVQVYGKARVLFTIPATAFRPMPKVESAAIEIDVAPRPWLETIGPDTFFEVVRAGFRTPRKQLHNALSQGLWMPPGGALELLAAAGIEPARRAQTLSVDEWYTVATAYVGLRKHWRAAPQNSKG